MVPLSGMRVNTSHAYWPEQNYYTTAPYHTGQPALVSPMSHEEFEDDDHEQDDEDGGSGNDGDSRKKQRFRPTIIEAWRILKLHSDAQN
ncbi:MAG: hypothetical protein M1833_003907 [Piccolia ochrophora]|nr:MAG: hypothetical protein M1833_003907 [Piccolia ochrophora]